VTNPQISLYLTFTFLLSFHCLRHRCHNGTHRTKYNFQDFLCPKSDDPIVTTSLNKPDIHTLVLHVLVMVLQWPAL
jgi:hypothetical protein